MIKATPPPLRSPIGVIASGRAFHADAGLERRRLASIPVGGAPVRASWVRPARLEQVHPDVSPGPALDGGSCSEQGDVLPAPAPSSGRFLARAVALRQEMPVPVDRNIRSLNDELSALCREHDDALASPLDAVSLQRALQLVPQIEVILIRMHTFFASPEGCALLRQIVQSGCPQELQTRLQDIQDANLAERHRWGVIQREQRLGAALFRQLSLQLSRQPSRETTAPLQPAYPTVRDLMDAARSSRRATSPARTRLARSNRVGQVVSVSTSARA